MKKILAWIMALLLGCSTFSFAAQGLRRYDASVQEYPAFSEAVHEADGNYEAIVKTDGVRPDFRALHPAYTVQGPDDAYVICFDSRQELLRALDAVQTMDGVMYAEENGVVKAQNEEPYEEGPTYMSYAANKIGLGKFTSQLLKRGDLEDVTVAVVDSGVTTSLPVFAGRVIEGMSFVKLPGESDQYSPYNTDEFNHGTAVASVIADCTQTLPVEIMPVKVLDETGSGSFLDTANGIRYAAENGADVVNLSLAAQSCSKYLHDAIDYALGLDCLPVTATGNFAGNLDKNGSCPAHLTQGISVSGCDADDHLYKKSGYGTAVDFCAPGVDVPCVQSNGSAGYASGTSFAAPHVSAVAAMLQLYMPAANCAILTSLLTQNARDIGDPGFDIYTGWGMPDLRSLDGTLIPDTVERTQIGMKVETLPNKTTYYYKETFDATGFSAKIQYSDGTSEIVQTGFTFVGADNMPRGTQTISAVRNGFHTEFTVQVRFHWWQWIVWTVLFGFLWY